MSAGASAAEDQAVRISGVTHRYGDREALRSLDLNVRQGELFALLGPNGGGKTTLFRLLATLIPIQQGRIEMLGCTLPHDLTRLRGLMGVVFQAPSLDRKLTVRENIRHQAALYGVRGAVLRARESEVLSQLGIADRAHDIVETLSGGLRRRVELAKGLLHHPHLLLMDEPSTGLDPGARADLWSYLQQLRDQSGLTILLTTHLLEEAEKADRIGILHEGRLVALDTPAALRATVGGDSITIECTEPDELAAAIVERFKLAAQVIDGRVRLEQSDAGRWIAQLAEAFPQRIHSITLAKPSLEEVFVRRTGHRFWQGGGEL